MHIITRRNPQPSSYTPRRVWYSGMFASGLSRKNSLNTIGLTTRSQQETYLHNCPLRLAPQAEDLCPDRGSGRSAASSAGGRHCEWLPQSRGCADLGKVGIRVAVVHEGVKKLHGLPNTHLRTIEPVVLLLFAEYEIPG